MKNDRDIRKKKIVNLRYQFRFAVFTVFCLVLYSFVFEAAILTPLAIQMQGAQTIEDKSSVAQVVLSLHDRAWPALMIALSLGFLFALLYSHRFVGPLVRLKKTIEESFLKGDFSKRIRFRRKDEFKEAEEGFNKLGEFLEKAQIENAAFLANLKKQLASIEKKLAEVDDLESNAAKISVSGLMSELEAWPNLFSQHEKK